MAWDAHNNGLCDSCGRKGPGHDSRRIAVEYLRALGWHHSHGRTIGGDEYDAILCPQCAKNEKQKKLTKSTLDDEPLPLNWEEFRPEARGPGYQSV